MNQGIVNDAVAPLAPSSKPHTSKLTTYFGYGSNLWLDQMARRCPNSTYLGVGRIDGYRWIIMERGYANIVTADASAGSSESNQASHVYGLLYLLTPTDETMLDGNEGVPEAYTKEELKTYVWWSNNGERIDVDNEPVVKSTLLYIDRKRITDSTPKTEYIARMNHGINDALDKGVPQTYVDKVMRKFIPRE